MRLFSWMNKPAIFTSMAVAAVVLAAIPTAMALSSPTAVVNTGRLNIREGPGVGYRAVATISQGDDVELLGRNADASWAQVRIAGGQVGWSSTAYLSTNIFFNTLPVVAANVELYAFVSTGMLNIRTGPGVGYPIIVTLNQYDTVSLVGRIANGDWLLIRTNSLLGWANAGFIGSSVPNATLPILDPATTVTAAPAGPVPHYGTALSIPPQLDVYTAPSLTSALVGAIPSGTQLLLAGRDATAGWAKVVLPGGGVGWVNANNIGTSIFVIDMPVLAQ